MIACIFLRLSRLIVLFLNRLHDTSVEGAWEGRCLYAAGGAAQLWGHNSVHVDWYFRSMFS